MHNRKIIYSFYSKIKHMDTCEILNTTGFAERSEATEIPIDKPEREILESALLSMLD